jgi:ketosteroid isomerase-like protein
MDDPDRRQATLVTGATGLLVVALACSVLAVSSVATESKGGPRAGPSQTQELYDQIAAMDRTLFAAVFDSCDIATLATLVTDDFEFYHDKDGLSSTSGAQFVKAIEGMCARQKTGVDYRARRELVADSMQVYPLNNYGAIQVGKHRFYQLLPGEPEKLVEISLFTNVWKKDAAGWKLARVLSYDHKLTD